LRARLEHYFSRDTRIGLLRRVHSLSIGSDALMLVALAGSLFFSISPDEARTKVFLYLAFTMAPFALMAPLIAPFIDQRATYRRKVVLASALIRFFAVAAMVFEINSLLLFPLALVCLVASKAYTVAKSSLVPETLSPSDPDSALVAANANITLLAAISGAIAATIGAGILKTPDLGPRVVLIVELFPLLVLIKAARDLAVRMPLTLDDPPSPPKEPRAAPFTTPHPRSPSTSGHSHVLLLSFVMSVLRGQVGFFIFLVAFALKDAHASVWVYAAVLAASSLGSALATQIVPRVRSHLPETAIIVAATVLVAAASLWLGTGTGNGGAIALAAILGVTSGGAKIAFDASVQHRLARHHHGRAFARYESTFQLAWVVGAFIPTVTRLTLSSGEALVGATALITLASFFISSAALRHSHDLADEEPPDYSGA